VPAFQGAGELDAFAISVVVHFGTSAVSEVRSA
jgi:hypothetical protein